MRWRSRRLTGFTLIELLVTIAILALLVSILLPSLRTAKTLARITKAHAELRAITLALHVYRHENERELPPTRFSCSTRSAYELPIELFEMNYFGKLRKGGVEAVAAADVFDPAETYRYRAVGDAIMNESTCMPNAASLWVPDTFPDCGGAEGRYHKNPKTSPVRYAVWSVGPSRRSPKFADTPGRALVPSRFWCRGAFDTGVVTHFEGRDGTMHMSP